MKVNIKNIFLITAFLISAGLSCYYMPDRGNEYDPKSDNYVEYVDPLSLPFYILTWDPADGETDVSPSTLITVTFNKPIDLIGSGSVTITTNGNISGNETYGVSDFMNGTIMPADNTNTIAILTPRNPFTAGESVTLTISGLYAQGIDGTVPLTGTTEISFTIAP